MSGYFFILFAVISFFLARAIGLKNPKALLVIAAGVSIPVGYFLLPYSLEIVDLERSEISNIVLPVFWIYLLAAASCIAGFMVFRGVSCSYPLRALSLKNKHPFIAVLVVQAVASLSVFYVFHATGIIPVLSSDPLLDKFFGSEMDAFAKFKGLYTIAIQSLSICATVSLFLIVDNRKNNRSRVYFIVLFLLAEFVLALTMKRGPAFVPFLLLLLYFYFIGKLSMRSLAITVSLLFVGASSLWYVGENIEPDSHPFLIVLSTNIFVEPREFIRLVVERGFQVGPYWGKTYIADLLGFIPTSMWSFKEKYYLSRLTMVLMGFTPDEAGTPRLGMAGEAYINFGIWGVASVSFFFGMAYAKFNRYLRGVMSEPTANPLIRVLYVNAYFNMGFAFYTNGSAAFLFVLITSGIILTIVSISSVNLKMRVS